MYHRHAARVYRYLLVRIVQPLWKFTGHTQDGASFEILVQAVSDQYVK